MSKFSYGPDLQRDCAQAALEIAASVRVHHEDGSLRGAAGALLLHHALGKDAPSVSGALRKSWEESVIACVTETDPSFDGGSPGASWALAVLDRHPSALQSIDAAVLDLLTEIPWDGGLGTLSGGLASYALYGYARRHTKAGTAILRMCVQHMAGLATRSNEEVRWFIESDMVLGASTKKRRKQETSIKLLNMEASAAIVASLALALKGGVGDAKVLLERGALTLASDVRAQSSDLIGVPTFHPVPGTLHGSATWAEGSAGAAAALLSATSALASTQVREACIAFGRDVANLDPLASHARDASLASGSSGIACVLHAYAEATGQNLFKLAAEHWFRRTLSSRSRKATKLDAGFRYLDASRSTDQGGGVWAARPGFTEGAAGTALALLCAVDEHRNAAKSIVWPALGL